MQKNVSLSNQRTYIYEHAAINNQIPQNVIASPYIIYNHQLLDRKDIISGISIVSLNDYSRIICSIRMITSIIVTR